jgi:predicted RNase H-like HicB family nuclease
MKDKKMQLRYLVVIEKGNDNYSAYAPDVPGCVTTGKTVQETLSNMREALELYFEVTLEDGAPIPIPYSTHADFVEFEIPTSASTTVRGKSRGGRQTHVRHEPGTRAVG